LGIAFLWVF
jgi:hypothetical protein